MLYKKQKINKGYSFSNSYRCWGQIPEKIILTTRILGEKHFFSWLKKQIKGSPPFKWWALGADENISSNSIL